MSTAGLYIRTSTKHQAKGAESQERAILEYCKKHEITDYVTYKDEGISGVKSSRPPINNFDKPLIHKFIFTELVDLGASPNTQRKVLKCLKRIFQVAVDDGYIPRNPASGISVKVEQARNKS